MFWLRQISMVISYRESYLPTSPNQSFTSLLVTPLRRSWARWAWFHP